MRVQVPAFATALLVTTATTAPLDVSYALLELTQAPLARQAAYDAQSVLSVASDLPHAVRAANAQLDQFA
jgi:hypothetical protein